MQKLLSSVVSASIIDRQTMKNLRLCDLRLSLGSGAWSSSP
jgi:hypothetical protein